jgi:hypothetical protein
VNVLCLSAAVAAWQGGETKKILVCVPLLGMMKMKWVRSVEREKKNR